MARLALCILILLVLPRNEGCIATPTINEYDAATGRVSAVQVWDADGVPPTYKRVEFTHDLAAKQETVKDRRGNSTIYSYDDKGDVIGVVNAKGEQTTNTYDPDRNLTSTTVAVGTPLAFTRSYTYDAKGSRTKESYTLGGQVVETRWTYTDNAKGVHVLETMTDPEGATTLNTYDPVTGHLSRTEVKDAAGNVMQATQFEYDTRGNPTAVVDHFGARRESDYDPQGLMTETRTLDPNGVLLERGTTSYYEDTVNPATRERYERAAGDTAAQLTKVAEVTVYDGYDSLNRPGNTRQSLDPLDPHNPAKQAVAETRYTANGQVDRTIDAKGTVTKHIYDTAGRLTSTTSAFGTAEAATESSTYDANDNLLTQTDRGGRVTEYTYDVLNRVTATKRAKATADEAVTSTAYDAQGRVASQTDGNGKITTYEYDLAGRRTKVTPPGGTGTLAYTYDKAGRQKTVKDHLNRITTYEYDAVGRRVRTTYPDSTSTSTTYDALGRRTAETDQAGVTTRYEYDPLSRLVKVIQPVVVDPVTQQATNPVTSYGYDALGRQTSQTDAKGNVTRYDYDALGRRTKRSLPDSKFEGLEYDKTGNLTRRTDFKNFITRYEYDLHNRLLKKLEGANSLATVSFIYHTTGQRQSMADPSGTTAYTYDNLDRIKTKATPQGTLSYTYDDEGNLLTTSSGNTSGVNLTYEYDVQNRIKKVVDNNLSPGTTTYNYTDVGSLDNYVYPNGVKHSYIFNNLNRLTNLTVTGPPGGGTTIASYAYTLGATGNRTMVAEAGGRRVQYSYDNLYRLTIESVIQDPAGVNGTVGYTYDLVGNRSRRESTVSGVPAATHLYDTRDRIDIGAYSYDDNGNTTGSPHPGGGSNTDTYDFEDRLIGRTRLGTTISIVYDGDGNRVSKTVNGVTTKYLVDTNNLTGYAQVLEELNGSNVVQKRYTYGSDLISQTILPAGTISFYIYDGHGSVRKLTTSAGIVTDSYDYDAFGIRIKVSGVTPNNYLYAGEQWDPDLGLYYLRGRYFTPSTARLWTMDTHEGSPGDPLTLHKYLYAHNNPVMNTDPSGHMTVGEAVVVLGIGLNIAFLIHDYVSLQSAVEAQDYGDASFYAASFVADGIFLIVPASSLFRGGTSLAVAGYGSVKAMAQGVKGAIQSATWGYIRAGVALSSATGTGGPTPNNGNWGGGAEHGGPKHDKAINDFIKSLRGDEAKGYVRRIRKGQAQVDVNGNKVGSNQPDVQYDVLNSDGSWQHVNLEYDLNRMNNAKHLKRNAAQDPDALNFGFNIGD